MQNKYFQIFLTYITNWRRLPLAMLWLTVGLTCIARSKDSSGDLWWLIVTLYAVPIIITHLKQQIAVTQSSMVPRYRVPHLIVAGVLLLPSLLLPPLVASWPHSDGSPNIVFKQRAISSTDFSPGTAPAYEVAFVPPAPHSLPYFPLLSLQLALATWIAWATYKPSGVMGVITIGGFVAFCAPSIRQAILQFLANPFSLFDILLCAVSLIATAGLARSFLHLTEEMPEYSRFKPLVYIGNAKNYSTNALASSPNFQSRWQQFVSSPRDSLLKHLVYNARPSLNQRISRWSAVGNKTHAMWLIGFIIAIPSLVISFYLTQSVALAAPILWLLPAPLMIGIAYQRCQLFGYQFLYPVFRSAFLIEQALMLGYEWAQVWLGMAVTLLVVTMAFGNTAAFTPLVFNLVLAAAGQIFCFAAVVWMLRFFSFRSLLIPILPVAFMAFPMEEVLAQSMGIRIFLIATVTVLILSLLILYDAYRRWMTADLA